MLPDVRFPLSIMLPQPRTRSTYAKSQLRAMQATGEIAEHQTAREERAAEGQLDARDLGQKEQRAGQRQHRDGRAERQAERRRLRIATAPDEHGERRGDIEQRIGDAVEAAQRANTSVYSILVAENWPGPNGNKLEGSKICGRALRQMVLG